MLDLQKENKTEYVKKVTAMASKVGLKVSMIKFVFDGYSVNYQTS